MVNEISQIANQIHQEHYPDAEVILLGGSFVRGEHTESSDLDLVVLYRAISHAYRASFFFQGKPVEAFVHDIETLHYFFEEVDRPAGIPALMQMVVEGIEIPLACSLSDQAKALAQKYLAMGPPSWDQERIDKARYGVSELIEDLRGAKDKAEQQAIVVRLYESYADYYFRSRGLWSGRGKWIPRRFRNLNTTYAEEVFTAVEGALRGEQEGLVELIEKELEKDGGRLFAGFRLNAPPTWRKKDNVVGGI